jgi:hypothetical protein
MSDPIEIIDAKSNKNTLVIQRVGMKGAKGDDGAIGTGFNSVRREKIDNPILWLFKKNKIAETIYPNNDASDLSILRTSEKRYIDKYGVLKVAANNELPETIDGYLIEPAGTNLVSRSEEIQNAAWTKGADYTVTGNTLDIADPYGTNLATKFEAGAAPGTYAITQAITSTAGFHSGSIFIYVPTQAGLNDFGVKFYFGSDEESVIGLTEFDKWVRVSAPVDSVSPFDFKLGIVKNGVAKPDLIDFYLFGAQAEKSMIATSYIKTAATTAARTGDSVTCDAYNNMPNMAEPFSFGLNVNVDSNQTSSAVSYIISFDEIGSVFASSSLVKQTDGSYLFRYADETNINDMAFNSPFDQIVTLVITFDGSNLKAYMNGQEVGEFLGVTAKPISDTASKVFIGRPIGAASNQYNGNYSNFRVWDFALTPDEVRYL